jgi:hypothetical protein
MPGKGKRVNDATIRPAVDPEYRNAPDNHEARINHNHPLSVSGKRDETTACARADAPAARGIGHPSPQDGACGPQPEMRAFVRQAFGPAERAMFRVLGIRQYLLLRRAAS